MNSFPCIFILDFNFISGTCFCGREKAWHDENGVTNRSGKTSWSPDEDTVAVNNECYGTISFSGFGQEVSQPAPVSKLLSKDIYLY